MSVIQRKPLTAFFFLTFLISWSLWIPRAASQYGWIGPVSPYWHFIGSLGPMLGALITAAVAYGLGGLTTLRRAALRWRVGWFCWAVAILGPAVVLLITILMVKAIGGPSPDWRVMTRVAEYPKLGFVALLIAEIFFYGCGEETGWRAFALPHLQKKYSALTASIILSVFWALWHIPLLITNESYRQMSSLMLVGWYASMLTGSILTTWLYNSSRGSLLLLAIFHGVLDIAMINQGLSIQLVNVMGMLTTFWGLAIIVLTGWRNLSRSPRVVWTTEDPRAETYRVQAQAK